MTANPTGWLMVSTVGKPTTTVLKKLSPVLFTRAAAVMRFFTPWVRMLTTSQLYPVLGRIKDGLLQLYCKTRSGRSGVTVKLPMLAE